MGNQEIEARQALSKAVAFVALLRLANDRRDGTDRDAAMKLNTSVLINEDRITIAKECFKRGMYEDTLATSLDILRSAPPEAFDLAANAVVLYMPELRLGQI